jgi:hypothetical protein
MSMENNSDESFKAAARTNLVDFFPTQTNTSE